MALREKSDKWPMGVAMRYNTKKPLKEVKMRWHPDSNWGMEALQASALPLGDATLLENREESIKIREIESTDFSFEGRLSFLFYNLF